MASTETVHLTLYIAGRTPAARRAQSNLETICRDVLTEADFRIEVIDIQHDPDAAEEERIVATPMVVRKQPPPPRRVVGDLSDREQVIFGLELSGA